MHLEPPGEGRFGRLKAAPGEHPPPTEAVDDDGRAQITSVRLDGHAAASLHRCGLEVGVALLDQELT